MKIALQTRRTESVINRSKRIPANRTLRAPDATSRSHEGHQFRQANTFSAVLTRVMIV